MAAASAMSSNITDAMKALAEGHVSTLMAITNLDRLVAQRLLMKVAPSETFTEDAVCVRRAAEAFFTGQHTALLLVHVPDDDDDEPSSFGSVKRARDQVDDEDDKDDKDDDDGDYEDDESSRKKRKLQDEAQEARIHMAKLAQSRIKKQQSEKILVKKRLDKIKADLGHVFAVTPRTTHGSTVYAFVVNVFMASRCHSGADLCVHVDLHRTKDGGLQFSECLHDQIIQRVRAVPALKDMYSEYKQSARLGVKTLKFMSKAFLSDGTVLGFNRVFFTHMQNNLVSCLTRVDAGILAQIQKCGQANNMQVHVDKLAEVPFPPGVSKGQQHIKCYAVTFRCEVALTATVHTYRDVNALYHMINAFHPDLPPSSDMFVGSVGNAERLIDTDCLVFADMVKYPIPSNLLAGNHSLQDFQGRRLLDLLNMERNPACELQKLVWTPLTAQISYCAPASILRTTPVKITRGGVVAEYMGAGKTLITLGLIGMDCVTDDGKLVSRSLPTLIVVPSTMLGQWVSETTKYMPGLVIVQYYGSKRHKISTEEMAAADIVLVTYGVVTASNKEDKLIKQKWKRVVCDEGHQLRGGPRTKLARKLRDLKVEVAKWILTGTPMPKSRNDLAGMLGLFDVGDMQSFCTNTPTGALRSRVSSLSQLVAGKMCFRFPKEKPLGDAGRDSLIVLPDVKETIVEVKLSEAEHKAYIAMQGLFIEWARFNSPLVRNQLITRLRNMLSFGDLQMPDRSSLPGNDPSKMSLAAVAKTVAREMPIADMPPFEAEECCICLDDLQDPVQTGCRHQFCKECIVGFLQGSYSLTCPMCRKPCPVTNLFRLFGTAETVVSSSSSSSGSSSSSSSSGPILNFTKINAVIAAVVELATLPPPVRSDKVTDLKTHTFKPDNAFVASEFHSPFFKDLVEDDDDDDDLVEAPMMMTDNDDDDLDLKTASSTAGVHKALVFTYSKKTFAVLRARFTTDPAVQSAVKVFFLMTGMTATARTKVIASFRACKTTSVMLMSVKACSVGINAAFANHLFFVSPGTVLAEEDQAIKRANRIGQVFDLDVRYFVVANTIEQGVYNFAHKKGNITTMTEVLSFNFTK
jgi:hypothetical protein